MQSIKKTSYEILALKWRPQNFNELVGQESVERTLKNAIKQNRLYPVLIFTGPRGTGKTSTARIIAKTLRCLDRKNEMPCNKCEQCLLIQEGKNLDVIEIDGASNNGVDAVRELRETVNYLPSQGSRKIYIIDEVHMLSNSAFNALLKTLEEPPEHVLFVMATTEAHKIPQTVMSRAQRLDFHLISPLLIKQHLEKICKTENLPLDDQALWLISKQAQGSLRDAQSLLDQMITFCGKDITVEKIIEILGLTDLEIIFKCLQAIIKRDEQQMLKVLKEIHSKGSEPKLILQELMIGLRNLIVLKVNPDNKPALVQTSQQEIDQWKQITAESSYEDLHFLFDMFLKGEQELLYSSDNFMVLEVLLLRFCQSPKLERILPFSFQDEEDSSPIQSATTPGLDSSQSKKTLAQPESNMKSNKKKDDLKSQNLNQAPIKETEFSKLNEHQDERQKNLQNSQGTSKNLQNSQGAGKKNSQNHSQNTDQSNQSKRDNKKNPQFIESISQDEGNYKASTKAQTKIFNQHDFIDFLKSKDSSLSSLFENLSFKQRKENNFIYSIPESFSYMKNKLQDSKNHQFLEETLNQFLNSSKEYCIQFEYSKTSLSSLKQQKEEQDQKTLFQNAINDPFTKSVTEIFDASITSVSKDN